jgi:hypothetical protein
MSFAKELTPLKDKRGLLVAEPGIGQGKRKFALSTLPYLQDSGIPIARLETSDGNLLTRAEWEVVRTAYEMSGRPGGFQKWIGDLRAGMAKPDVKDAETKKSKFKNAVLQRLTEMLNHELLQVLGDHEFLSFHGLTGKGAKKRYFAEGDAVHPEPSAVDNNTTIFAPTQTVADNLIRMGHPAEKIEITGLILPKSLKNPLRVEERIKTFSQDEPTTERPLTIAFMLTGQLAHMQELHTLLSDPEVSKWIKEKRARVDVYLWNGKKQAHAVARYASLMGLNPKVDTKYNPDSKHGVQLYWNDEPDTAVITTFDMIETADFLVGPPTEYVGWFAGIPGYSLNALRGNRKMETNQQWLEQNKLVTPQSKGGSFGEILLAQFAPDGQPIINHYSQAHKLFPEGVGLNGAENIAQRMIEVVTQ